MIWSDHGTNFVTAGREIEQLLKNSETRQTISSDCSEQNVQWKFIPEQASYLGRLWEAVVKRLNFHFKRIVVDFKLNF